jgi:hypothetical protein
MTAEEVADRLEITEVLARYCHAVDNGDLEMALGVYWPDATDHHGDHWDGNGQEYMRNLIGRFAATCPPGSGRRACVHQLGGVLIAPGGPDGARVQCSFTAFVPREEDGAERLALLVGRFLDRFQRRDGEWRILERTVVNDFSRADLGGPIYGPGSWQAGGYPAGGFGAANPGVGFLASAFAERAGKR